MNSIFSIKSSIALLVLGSAMLATPKHPPKPTATMSDYQPSIAASAIGAIANTIQYETV